MPQVIVPLGEERLDVFMARANAAYYADRDPFADFTTAPEISQVFGEILGLWAAVVWRAMGQPARVLLVEAGPGRGTLIADALRAIHAGVPAFAEALTVCLIEASPRLRDAQRRVVADARWYGDLEAVPDGPMILLANEFLDALPVRQFTRGPEGWQERYVAARKLVERPAAPPAPVLAKADAVAGSVFEFSAAAEEFVTRAADRIARHGGAALLIDYGPSEASSGDSLQAIRDRKPTDPFREPGTADLTAHVDFPALVAAARRQGVTIHGPMPQGVFLTRLGLFQRTDRLARGQSPAKAMSLIAGARRLAEPDQMGRLFKVMALCHPNLPLLPGFQE